LRERYKGKERQVKRNKRRYRYSVNNRLEGRRSDRKEKRQETGWKGGLNMRRKLLNVPTGLTSVREET